MKNHSGKTLTWLVLCTLVILASAIYIAKTSDRHLSLKHVIIDDAACISRGDGPPEPIDATDEENSQTRDAPPGPHRRLPVDPKGLVLSGRVVDGRSGLPVHDYRLAVSRYAGRDRSLWGDRELRTVTKQRIVDADGVFSVRVDGGGEFTLDVDSAGYVEAGIDPLFVNGPEGVRDLVILMEPGMEVRGVVTDARDRAPIAGAMVFEGRQGRTMSVAALREGGDFTLTDEKGNFALDGLTERDGCAEIAVFHESYAPARIIARPTDGMRVIELQRGRIVFGTVRDDCGAPLRGVSIFASDEQNAAYGSVVSGEDGSYRTFPVNPGRVRVSASLPGSGRQCATAAASGDFTGKFTEEIKVVDVFDEDARVDFGPTDEHVMLGGILYAQGGTPIADASIRIMQIDHRFPPVGAVAVTDSTGFYEFTKVSRGVYLVTVELSEGASIVSLPNVSVMSPGRWTQDLKIPGGSISGYVVNQEGEPRAGGIVSAAARFAEGHVRGDRKARVGDDGSFRLAGLSQGEYTIEYIEQDRRFENEAVVDSSGSLVHFRVGEDEPLENLTLVFADRGRVLLRGSGYDPAEGRWIEVHYIEMPSTCPCEKGEHFYSTLEHRIDGNGDLYRPEVLRKGRWTIRICRDGGETVDRIVNVERHGEIEVVVDRFELGNGTHLVPLKAILTRPLAESRSGLGLELTKRAPRENVIQNLRLRAEPEGVFLCDHVPHGRWDLWLLTNRREKTTRISRTLVASLDVNEMSPRPLVVEVGVPAGTVSAELFDTVSGERMGDWFCGWSAYLLDGTGGNDDERVVVQGGEGGRVRFEYVPEGTYRLRVQAPDYLPFISKPFRLQAGQELHMGPTGLTPSGMVVLEAIDAAGGTIDAKVNFCPLSGPPVAVPTFGLSRGKRYFEAPAGVTRVKVGSPGYKDLVFQVAVKQGKIEEKRVVLEKK